jgi:hypothetical protein
MVQTGTIFIDRYTQCIAGVGSMHASSHIVEPYAAAPSRTENADAVQTPSAQGRDLSNTAAALAEGSLVLVVAVAIGHSPTLCFRVFCIDGSVL